MPWPGESKAPLPASKTEGAFRDFRATALLCGCNLIDVGIPLKQTPSSLPALTPDRSARWKWLILGRQALVLAVAIAGCFAPAPASAQEGPPPSTGGFFPLRQVHAGMHATAWTVFSGTKPEAIDLEILGILRGARGPGHDLILAQLKGARAEYTGVVDGMSGSPVYISNKLVGALSYRIGQFAKDPIAGITPIEQMLEVRNLPIRDGMREADNAQPGESIAPVSTPALPAASTLPASSAADLAQSNTFQMLATPLTISGLSPAAVRLWQEKMAGTSLGQVSAGGVNGSSETAGSYEPSPSAEATVVPGSAVSAQLVRGDVEISATCTVTYIDPKQLLACGHPFLQAGPVSLPMTTAEVVTTLASPLNAFKIINTGTTIGAFTEDRDAGIRGVIGSRAHMIPMHISVDSPEGKRQVNVDILDMPALTPQAMEVVLYQSLLQANDSTTGTSYHVTGSIDIGGHAPAPMDLWVAPGEALPAPMQAALQAGELFTQLYSNSARQTGIRAIDVQVQAVPRRLGIELETARLISNDSAHAGEKIVIEATVRPWEQPERNVRIPITLPPRLITGNLRLLVSDGATLDRTLNQPRLAGHPADLDALLAQDRRLHAADRIYVSLLVPETQAAVSGETLTSLPLSMANALEPLRTTQEAGLNGESAVVLGDVAAGGVLSGFQMLNVHIEPGGGLD